MTTTVATAQQPTSRPASPASPGRLASPLIEIEHGLWIQPRKVVAVREHADDETCTIYFAGQAPSEGQGFLINREAGETIAEINEALHALEVD